MNGVALILRLVVQWSHRRLIANYLFDHMITKWTEDRGPALAKPKPAYPPEAKKLGIQGQVAMMVLINTQTGSVEQACVVARDAALADASKAAANTNTRRRSSPITL
jgi:hypothetical protein